MCENRQVTSAEPELGVTPTRWSAATVRDGMWLDPQDDPREDGVVPDDDERSTLLDYLRRYRLTAELKCSGLDSEQLARRSVPPSTMSLLGLLRHLGEVERHWFRRQLAGQHAPQLYCTDADPDGDWHGAVADPDLVSEAWATWREEVDFAARFVAETPDLGLRGASGVPLRDVLVHLIEEYARHCGHADLLRECIDGRVGQ